MLLLGPTQEVGHCCLESGNLLALSDAHLALRKRSPVGSFDLTGNARIALLRALLDVMPIEDEVVPVDISPLKN